MTVLATVELPAEEFVLDTVIALDPEVELEFEPIVPLGAASSPHLRMHGAAMTEFESALEADPDIAWFSIVHADEATAIARIQWETDRGGLVEAVEDTGGTILTAVGHGRSWQLQLRFGSHDELSACYQQSGQRELSVTLLGVRNPHHETRRDEDGLTPAQYQTLQVAYERGFFEVPRGITLAGLAEELSVSDTAVSQRLRRGLSTLVATQLQDPAQGRASRRRTDRGDDRS